MSGRYPRIVIAAIAAAAMQSAALLAIIEWRAEIRHDGAGILLLTKPMDPDDGIGGGYTHLGYGFAPAPPDDRSHTGLRRLTPSM